MENCLPFTDDVMVVLVYKCVQKTHLLVQLKSATSPAIAGLVA